MNYDHEILEQPLSKLDNPTDSTHSRGSVQQYQHVLFSTHPGRKYTESTSPRSTWTLKGVRRLTGAEAEEVEAEEVGRPRSARRWPVERQEEGMGTRKGILMGITSHYV